MINIRSRHIECQGCFTKNSRSGPVFPSEVVYLLSSNSLSIRNPKQPKEGLASTSPELTDVTCPFNECQGSHLKFVGWLVSCQKSVNVTNVK